MIRRGATAGRFGRATRKSLTQEAGMTELPGDRAAVDRLVEELKVEGWCRPAERAVLYALARYGPGAGEIVEIGTWQGLSTLYLAAGSKVAGREQVTTIDPDTADNWATVHRNLLYAGVADWVTVLTAESTAAAREWAGQPIRLLYLDGDHHYEQVVRDFQAWQSFVAPGGVVAFHDALEPRWPGVSQAIDELLLAGDWMAYRVAHRRLPASANAVDPVTSSIVVAQKRGGTEAPVVALGQGPFVTIRELYDQLREQQELLHYALAHGGALPDAVSSSINPENPTVVHMAMQSEREALNAKIAHIEGQFHAVEEYALELEEQFEAVQREFERVAAQNQALSSALQAANPIKRRVRAYLGRHW
jgi:predicted O-methyltransferase YrrM